MLVLVAGVTGNIGQHLITCLIQRPNQVRRLGRNRSNLSSSTLTSLKSFVESSSYADTQALATACQEVDAVICAYSDIPELRLKGQLLLIRAAERTGVRRFVAANWNYDWGDMALGQHESYDPYISFRNQVDLSVSIRPICIFCGVLAEVLFSVPGHEDFSPANHGVWDPERKRLETWGSGRKIWHWMMEKNAVEFAVETVLHDDAERGGFWTVASGGHSLRQIADVCSRVGSRDVQVDTIDDENDLRQRALQARLVGDRKHFWEYIGWFNQWYTVDGAWALRRFRTSSWACAQPH